jgi:glycosyltransferase involved in cell wall biosynthesis
MPTLLQINTVVNQGSTGRIAEAIGKTALAAGWRSIIAHGRPTASSASETICMGNSLHRYHHAIATRLLDRHGLHSRGPTRSLIREIDRIKPDVVHLHNVHGYYLNYPMLFDFLHTAGIPVSWTLHDCWPFTGHCAYFDTAACDRWLNGCHHCPLLHTYPTGWFFDRSRLNWQEKRFAFTRLPKIDIVTPSHWLARHTRASFLGANPIRVIHLGIDVEQFRPHIDAEDRWRPLFGNHRVVLAVASQWDARKGLADVMELRSRLPHDEFAIAVVGVTRRQARQLPEGIIPILRTDTVHTLASLYSRANVFINPTCADNFPVTNLEALACGTPVVTYAAGGSPEAVNAETGVVVPIGNVESMATAIRHCANRDRSSTRQTCRSRAVELFNESQQYATYLELFRGQHLGLSAKPAPSAAGVT